jgi:hypothetical protein
MTKNIEVTCACCGKPVPTSGTEDDRGLLTGIVVARCPTCLADEYAHGYRDGVSFMVSKTKRKAKSDG